jgi:hypothetical protein
MPIPTDTTSRPNCRGFFPWQPAFYTEFNGRRPKRLIIKVLGE